MRHSKSIVGGAGAVALALVVSSCSPDNEPGRITAQVLVPPPDNEFVAFSCGGNPAGDGVGGTGGADVDIVGDSTYPALLRAYDGTFLYLRMRLDGSPVDGSGDLNPKNWGFLFDTDGDPTSFEYLLNVDGVEKTVEWEFNDVQDPPDKPGDGVRTVLNSFTPIMDFYEVKATGDGSSFSNNTDYFLTVALPVTVLDAAGISTTSPVPIWGATSTNNTNFTADLSCASNGNPGLNGNQTGTDPLDPACLLDTDNDGVCDVLDMCPGGNDAVDPDMDGICSFLDNCPLDANPLQEDADNDGIGDACDTCPNDPDNDTDADGVCGDVDNCPSISNSGQQDDDSDGLGNACDSCPDDPNNDSDGDGACGDVDNCPNIANPGQEDGDSDGIGDACDTCPNDPANDVDGDGVCGDVDVCPITFDPGQADSDGDGLGDACDTCANDPNDDLDGDGVCGDIDNCPIYNPAQTDMDSDGAGDACDPCPLDPDDDADSDGVCGNVDNCPDVVNPQQEDRDGDGIGDVCDGCPDSPGDDLDGDGVCDNDDICPDDPDPDQIDSDGDGPGDACDVCPNDPLDDADGDGFCADEDNCPEVSNPDQADLDEDGLGDVCDRDDDGDGIDDIYGVTGGGCSSSGSGGGFGGLLLMLVVLLGVGMRNRRRVAPAIAALAVFAVATPARAQLATESTFSVERFRLTTASNGILNVEWGDVPKHLGWAVSAWIGNADDTLVVVDQTDPDRMRIGSLVDARVGGALAGSVALWDRLAIGLTVPIVFYQNGDEIAGVTMASDLASGGLGDIELDAKFAFLPMLKNLGLALRAALSVPSATGSDDFLGEESVAFTSEVIFSGRYGRFRGAVNAGTKIREDVEFANLGVEDELFARLGVGVTVVDNLELAATLTLATALTDPGGAENQGVADSLLGAEYDVPGPLSIFAAGGAALDAGFGGPDWRLLGGARVSSPREGDKDGDGIVDSADQCPLRAEDKDGFEDVDGCPDLDNDADGVPDETDGAPNDPEDRDGFQDEDGIPDPDNDQDGIADVKDRCPVDAENMNGFEDTDGCPDDADPDKDGILGDADRCPQEPEDIDQYEDQNGCPDPDNDEDSLLDPSDNCPNEAGPIENRGCPDSDRDGDTVVDRLDNCPDEPGSVKNHGCKAKQLVQITPTKLLIVGTVRFASGRAVVRRRSYRLLDNVASVLKAHPEILKVMVEGHTDDRGKDAYNLNLSQKRAEAVSKYLVKRGVEKTRLEAKGFGEGKPIETNKTAAGRQANRRVEFTILSSTVRVQPAGSAGNAAASPGAVASGQKTIAQVTAKYGESRKQVMRCYQKAVKSDPGLQVDNAELLVRVDQDGRTSAKTSGISNVNLLICLQSMVRSWRFPKPDKPVDVSLKLLFK